jgi:hypothetical protein
MALETTAQIDVLTAEECRGARDLLHTLQNSWVVRKTAIPFYTLGAASYLDAKPGFDHYRRVAEQFNPVLNEHFAWLHARVADSLSRFLCEPVVCSPVLALPGFHIYLGCKLFEKPIASVHFDLQYDLLAWEQPELCDFDHPLSLTLPLALPATGGGLFTWNVEYNEARDLDDTAFKELVNQRTQQYHAYSLGRMFVHSGHTLHQAAPGRDLKLTDERITLQGHAVRCGGKWQLYW